MWLLLRLSKYYPFGEKSTKVHPTLIYFLFLLSQCIFRPCGGIILSHLCSYYLYPSMASCLVMSTVNHFILSVSLLSALLLLSRTFPFENATYTTSINYLLLPRTTSTSTNMINTKIKTLSVYINIIAIRTIATVSTTIITNYDDIIRFVQCMVRFVL